MSFRNPQVNLYVADPETAAGFYSTLFGFMESFRTPRSGPPKHVELRLEGFVLGLASREAARDAHGLDPGAGAPQAELVVWTDALEDDYRGLLDKGARSLREPHDFGGALRAAWIADPDGNPIQVVQKIAPGSTGT